MRNKLTAVLLIAALCFTLSACGGSKPAELEWENDGESYIAQYDFGMDVAFDGTMLGTLDKLNYKDLEGEQETLKEKTEQCIEESDLGSYELLTDYEEMEETMEEAIEAEFEMGDFLYCTGTEEDDLELGVLETAAYHNPTENKYHQYIIYNTKSYYGAEETDCEEIAELMSRAFGITVDTEKLQEACKVIEEKAKASEMVEYEDEEGDEELELEEGEASDEELEEGDAVEGEDLEEGEDSEEELSEDDYEIEFEDGEGAEFVDEDGNPINLDDLDLDFGDEGGDYMPCFMKQQMEKKGDGYTDDTTFYLIAENVGDDTIVIYAAVERYRCYDEQ